MKGRMEGGGGSTGKGEGGLLRKQRSGEGCHLQPSCRILNAHYHLIARGKVCLIVCPAQHALIPFGPCLRWAGSGSLLRVRRGDSVRTDCFVGAQIANRHCRMGACMRSVKNGALVSLLVIYCLTCFVALKRSEVVFAAKISICYHSQ